MEGALSLRMAVLTSKATGRPARTPMAGGEDPKRGRELRRAWGERAAAARVIQWREAKSSRR